MNKKAESSFENAETIIFFVVTMFITTILVFTFAFLIGAYTDNLTRIPGEFRAEVTSLRFTNSADCFAYEDERVFPGIIDLSKFNNRQMGICYNTENQNEMNFKLQLESNLDYYVKTNNYFEVDRFTIIKDVVVKDGTNFRKDKLFIFIQNGLVS